MASVSSLRRCVRAAVTCDSLGEAWHWDLHPDISIRLSQYCSMRNKPNPARLMSPPVAEEGKAGMENLRRAKYSE